jgi:hypothetical protein
LWIVNSSEAIVDFHLSSDINYDPEFLDLLPDDRDLVFAPLTGGMSYSFNRSWIFEYPFPNSDSVVNCRWTMSKSQQTVFDPLTQSARAEFIETSLEKRADAFHNQSRELFEILGQTPSVATLTDNATALGRNIAVFINSHHQVSWCLNEDLQERLILKTGLDPRWNPRFTVPDEILTAINRWTDDLVRHHREILTALQQSPPADRQRVFTFIYWMDRIRAMILRGTDTTPTIFSQFYMAMVFDPDFTYTVKGTDEETKTRQLALAQMAAFRQSQPPPTNTNPIDNQTPKPPSELGTYKEPKAFEVIPISSLPLEEQQQIQDSTPVIHERKEVELDSSILRSMVSGLEGKLIANPAIQLASLTFTSRKGYYVDYSHGTQTWDYNNSNLLTLSPHTIVDAESLSAQIGQQILPRAVQPPRLAQLNAATLEGFYIYQTFPPKTYSFQNGHSMFGVRSPEPFIQWISKAPISYSEDLPGPYAQEDNRPVQLGFVPPSNPHEYFNNCDDVYALAIHGTKIRFAQWYFRSHPEDSYQFEGSNKIDVIIRANFGGKPFLGLSQYDGCLSIPHPRPSDFEND